MGRIWKTSILVLATLYFVLDGLFFYVTRPISVWISKMRFLERIRRWVVSLRPYPSLALFPAPGIVLEPAKPVGGYVAATGHFFAGAITFVTAEVLKLSWVERLFQLNRKKLLSIPAFATGYKYWRRMMDALKSLEVWKTQGGQQNNPHPLFG